jgi:hypothetical protein
MTPTDNERSAVPRISEQHVQVMCAAVKRLEGLNRVGYVETGREIEWLLASLHSGELSLVKTAEIEELIELSRHAGDVNFYTHKGVVRIVIENLKRWLPTHPAQQNAPLSETTFMRHDNPACGDPTCMTCRGTRTAHPAQSDTEKKQ